jgi:hypothetical protein
MGGIVQWVEEIRPVHPILYWLADVDLQRRFRPSPSPEKSADWVALLRLSPGSRSVPNITGNRRLPCDRRMQELAQFEILIGPRSANMSVCSFLSHPRHYLLDPVCHWWHVNWRTQRMGRFIGDEVRTTGNRFVAVPSCVLNQLIGSAAAARARRPYERLRIQRCQGSAR